MVNIIIISDGVRGIQNKLTSMGHRVTVKTSDQTVDYYKQFDLIITSRINYGNFPNALNAIMYGIPFIDGSPRSGTPFVVQLGLADEHNWYNNNSNYDMDILRGDLLNVDGGIQEIFTYATYLPKGDTTTSRTDGVVIAKNIGKGTPSILAYKAGTTTNLGKTKATILAAGFLYGADISVSPGEAMLDGLINLAINGIPEEGTLDGYTTLDGSPISIDVSVVGVKGTDFFAVDTVRSNIEGYYSLIVDITKYDYFMTFSSQRYGIAWTTGITLSEGDTVHPTTPNGYFYEALTAGNTGAVEPVWTTDESTTIIDGGITWQPRILLKPEIQGYVTPTPIT